MGFSWWEYWSGLPFPSPGDLPHPGIKSKSPEFPALQTDSLQLSQQGRRLTHIYGTEKDGADEPIWGYREREGIYCMTQGTQTKCSVKNDALIGSDYGEEV